MENVTCFLGKKFAGKVAGSVVLKLAKTEASRADRTHLWRANENIHCAFSLIEFAGIDSSWQQLEQDNPLHNFMLFRSPHVGH